jgi:hypothetical protein
LDKKIETPGFCSTFCIEICELTEFEKTQKRGIVDKAQAQAADAILRGARNNNNNNNYYCTSPLCRDNGGKCLTAKYILSVGPSSTEVCVSRSK